MQIKQIALNANDANAHFAWWRFYTSYLTLMLMLIWFEYGFYFEIPSVLENQSFGKIDMNNIEPEINVQYSFLFFQSQTTRWIRQVRGRDRINGWNLLVPLIFLIWCTWQGFWWNKLERCSKICLYLTSCW